MRPDIWSDPIFLAAAGWGCFIFGLRSVRPDTRSAHMRGMETTPQIPAPTAFDSAALAKKLAATITDQIIDTFGTDGTLRRAMAEAVVDDYLAEMLRSLA